MRLLKGLVITLAIGGIAALAMAARAAPRPLTQLDRIAPGMNFAYVRVRGAVMSHPAFDAHSGFLSFVLRDETGQVRVTAYRKAAQALAQAGRIPAPGDRVEAEGVLRIRDDDVTLALNTADALSVTRPTATLIDLSALHALELGERASSAGQVRRMRAISDGLWVITLRDGGALGDVLLRGDAPPAFAEGDWLRVTGAVASYRDARQLLPATAEDVTVIASPPAQPRPIAALNRDLLGQWITVRAEVIELRPFKLGMRLALRDDDLEQIDVVAFDRVWQSTSLSPTLASGDVIVVSGVLTDFHGKLELLPEIGADLRR